MNKFFKIAAMLVVFMALALSGCAGIADVRDYAEKQILIHGLTEADFSITVADLMALGATSQKAEASRSDGEKVKIEAVGPTLDTFLSAYGFKQSDFKTIRFTAKDKYAIAVPENILKTRQIILAYADGKQSLPKEDWPLRVVIPEERAMYWVRMLERIDFEKDSGPVLSQKLVFLDNAILGLPNEDYQDGTETAKAVKTADLVAAYATAMDAENVYFVASDGLEKNETTKNFLSAYIKYTGQNAPKFLAPHFPQGMHINGLLGFSYGETAFYSLAQAAALTANPTVLPFSDILKTISMVDGGNYVFTGVDCKKVSLTAEQVLNGSFCLENDKWCFIYGESQQEVIKDVLVIEPIK